MGSSTHWGSQGVAQLLDSHALGRKHVEEVTVGGVLRSAITSKVDMTAASHGTEVQHVSTINLAG